MDGDSAASRLRVAARNLTLLAVFAFAAICLLRFADFDNIVLIALVAISPVALAVSVVTAGALTSLRWGVGGLVVVVVAALLALPGTVVPRTGCEVRASDQDNSVVVMSHNILAGNAQVDSLLAQVDRVDPDILLLQETTDAQFAALGVDLESEYPNRESLGLQHIVSRWPLSERFESGTSTGGALVATVESPIGAIRIANVHPSAPLSDERRTNQRQEYTDLTRWRVEQSVDLIMGDFNASGAHAIYRDIVSDSYEDAHRVAGCGSGLTWSRTLGTGPAILSLDHALVHDRLQAESFVVLDYAGSDHKAVAVEVTASRR